MVRITGGCHCGAVLYEAEIDPARVSICHCTDCQTLTGSPFRLTVSTAPEQLRIIEGQPRLYEKAGDNGNIRIQYFCAACGSPLFATGRGQDASTIGIRWGTIHERDTLVPRRQIWRRSAVDWLGRVDALPARDCD